MTNAAIYTTFSAIYTDSDGQVQASGTMKTEREVRAWTGDHDASVIKKTTGFSDGTTTDWTLNRGS